MPNRSTHQAITTACAFVSLPLAAYLPLDSFLAFELGVLVTLIPEFTPDLDISHRKFKGLGEFIGLKSYAKIVPHRYGVGKKHWTRLRIWNIFFFSHIPLVGTLLRTVLLCLPLLLLGMLLWAYLSSTIASWLPYLAVYFLYLWWGMSWSDLWHVVADRPWSKHGDRREMSRDFWYGRGQYERELERRGRR